MQHPVSARRSGFTLVELLIVIGVIVVLIALLLPSVASVRARARSVEAQSNLAQLGLALNAANRNRSTPVMHKDSNGILWTKQIQPFLEGENEALFVSPADPNAEERGPDEPSFAANNQMHRMGSGDGRKIVILDFEEEGLPSGQDGVFDAAPPGASNQWTPEVEGNWQNALDAAGQRQGGNVNVLRHDGSVSSESAQDLMDYHPQNSPEDWVPWRADNRWECPDGPDGCSPPEALTTDLTPDVPDAPLDDPSSGGGGEGSGGDDGEGSGSDDGEGSGDEGSDGEEGESTSCPPPFPELEGWHVDIHGYIGQAQINTNDFRYALPISDDSHSRVRYVIEPDEDCNYQIEIEDAGDWDYDTWLKVKRLEDGNILLQYLFTGNGTWMGHTLKDPEGNHHLGPINCPSGNCGSQHPDGHLIGTVIIPGNPGADQCGCNVGPPSADPPDGTASWKGYNLGGGQHPGSSEVGGLVFQESGLATPTNGSLGTTTISGTADDPLWQTVYQKNGFALMSLKIPVENPGTYKVTFYSSSTTSCPTPNQNITLENQLAISNWQPSPGGAPSQQQATSEVNDGELNVLVQGGGTDIFNAQVVLSAIVVEELE